MSSKRDLVEAHSFNRRRLVTAFISGAPGGREVEPVRPGRTLVGGLVLAVLLVAGAGVAGFLHPTLPDDWKERGLVVGKETGSRYLALDGKLYPVINTTSARLLLDDFELTFAPEEQIAEQNPGVTIGIPGAPDALPAPENLVRSGWTSCVDNGERVKTRIGEEPAARAMPNGAAVVEAAGTTYVVTGEDRAANRPGARYVVPDAHRDATLRALGLDNQTIRPVPGVWLDLFPLGGPLVPFEVPGSGRPAPAGLHTPDGVSVVGSTVLVDGRPFVLARDGLVGLTDFEYAMYRSGGRGSHLPQVEVTSGDVASVPISDEEPAPGDWPTEAVSSYVPASDDPSGSVCVLLQTHDDKAGDVTLAVPTSEAAVPASDAGLRTVEVDNGHGALVQATGGSAVNRGTVYLVDAEGTRFPLGGTVTDTLASLGYEGVAAADVPISWADLFPDGPELSWQQAWQPAVSQ